MAVYTQVSGGKLTSAVKIWYDKDLLDWAESKVYYYQFAEKHPIPANAGKQIEFTRYRPLPITGSLTEGTVPDNIGLSADKHTLTIRQLGAFTKVSDYVNLTAITPVVQAAMEKLRSQSPRAIDKFIAHSLYVCTTGYSKRSALDGVIKNLYTLTGKKIARLVSGQTEAEGGEGFPIYHNKTRKTASLLLTTIARTGLTVKTIRDAVNVLRTRDIEPFEDGNYVGIAYPTAIKQLREDTAWKSWHQYTAPEFMYKGEVGQVEGVRFVQSTNYNRVALTGDTQSTSSAALFTTVIFGKGAYGVTELGNIGWYTKNGESETANPLSQYSTVGWKVAMAATTLNKSAGIIICSTENKG